MADLRVEGADWLLTLDRERRILRDGAVAVADGRIVAVGKTDDIARDHPAQRVISARGKVVTPGLVDSHIHTTFQMSRGLADEVGSKRFLFERMYPYEAALDEAEGDVLLDGQAMRGVVESGAQPRERLVAHQHQVGDLGQVARHGLVEAGGAVLDGVEPVGRQGGADGQMGSVKRLRRQPLNRVAINGVDRGWLVNHWISRVSTELRQILS